MIEESRFDRLVGVDVGGTKTHLACVDTAGERRDVIRASSDWRSGHLFSDDGNLPRLAAWIGSLARFDEGSRVVVGLRDCDTDADLEVSRTVLSDALGLPVRVENDADLLAPAIGAEPAIAMIVGTGSIVSARDSSGRRVTADGHGWLFGDWGSGPGLVRDAIGRLLTHSDRGGSHDDPLIHALCDHFDARDTIELTSAATIRADPDVWGSAAVRVFEAADQGSPLAHDTIAAAADRLVDGVDAVLRRGGLGDRVVAAGGVIVNQPRLRDAVRDRLALRRDPLGLHTLDVAPVEGALRLAERIVAR